MDPLSVSCTHSIVFAAPEMLAQCEGFAGHVEVPPPAASGSSMWSFLLYVAAVSVGILLYMLYEPAQEKPSDYDDDDDASSTSSRTGSLKKKSGTGGGQKRSRRFRENQRLQQQRFQLSSLFAALGLRWVENLFCYITSLFYKFLKLKKNNPYL